MPIPFFSKIVNNELRLKSIFIGPAQAKALSNFLIKADDRKYNKFAESREMLIKQLFLDDCGLKDESFAEILKSLIKQKKVESISYINNEFGPKS